ncbi:MAG: CoA transferase [Saprospiraceae bacterium]|nr:CoA transferase [Saprospiraceae bacterium]
MELKEIFKDLKVVELASVLAGPAVGMFFAELGATVIKIENKTTGGDVTRSWKVPEEDSESDYSAYYCSVNWHKKIYFFDLQKDEDQVFVHDIIKNADIIISNFKRTSAEKMRMDYDFLKTLNPGLIFGQITGYGENDDTPAFDVVLQAEAGFLYMTGEPGRNPVKMPVALIDILAAHQLKEAILLALLKRQMTGEGSYVSVSLFESAVASLANQATNWLMAGHIPQRMGTRHPNIAPYGDIFETKDNEQIVIAVGTDRQFENLCKVLNIKPNEQFLTNAKRVKNRVDLIGFLQLAFRQFDRDEILQRFRESGVPAAAIRTMPEVFEHPLAKNMILEEIMPASPSASLWRPKDGRLSRRVKTLVFTAK